MPVASTACLGWNDLVAQYDGIIIGAGHNGLILQAYLGKAGLKTLCIERRHVAGGGLSTVEDPRHPGFLHNTHAFFQRAITTMPWYADLELERHGAHYIEPELNVALLTRDGGALEWWTDIDRTVASFGEFSRRDAETLRRRSRNPRRRSDPRTAICGVVAQPDADVYRPPRQRARAASYP